MKRKPFDIIAHDLRFVISPVSQIEAGSVQLSEEFRQTWTIGDLNRHHVSLADRDQLTGRYDDLRERLEEQPSGYFGEFDVHQRGPRGGGWGLTVNLGGDGFASLLRGIELVGMENAYLCMDVTRSDFISITDGFDAALLQCPPRVEIRLQNQL